MRFWTWHDYTASNGYHQASNSYDVSPFFDEAKPVQGISTAPAQEHTKNALCRRLGQQKESVTQSPDL
jgi:hypothetical protein